MIIAIHSVWQEEEEPHHHIHHHDHDHDDDDGANGTRRAAAAMAVGVGSFCDPDTLQVHTPMINDASDDGLCGSQGCSHFLEHMLFMGSAAFPDENDYDAFLTRNGGGSNAFTELVRITCTRITCDRMVLVPSAAAVLPTNAAHRR